MAQTRLFLHGNRMANNGTATLYNESGEKVTGRFHMKVHQKLCRHQEGGSNLVYF